VTAHQHRFPGHLKFLRHTLAPRGAIPRRDSRGLSALGVGCACSVSDGSFLRNLSLYPVPCADATAQGLLPRVGEHHYLTPLGQ
jgi:hypothetical protein